MPKHKNPTAKDLPKSESFQSFAEMVRQVASAPKSEVDRKIAEDSEPRKKGSPKPTSEPKPEEA